MKPELLLDGKLVRLLSFGTADIDERYVGWLNDPEVMRYSNQRFRSHDAESCRAYLENFVGTPNLFLSVRRRSDDQRIGTMTAYRNIHHGTADVGILIGDRSCWGSGYGQDAWDTLLGWLLTNAGDRKVTAGTLACNAGMVRLMERSGMQLEGVRKGQELVQSVPEDIVLYGKFAR